MSSSELSAATIVPVRDSVNEISTAVDHLLENVETEPIDPAAAADLLVAAVRLYSGCVDQRGEMLQLRHNAVTATEVMTAASAILKCVNVAPFELGLWQAWHL
jgi:hypothetical protein